MYTPFYYMYTPLYFTYASKKVQRTKLPHHFSRERAPQAPQMSRSRSHFDKKVAEWKGKNGVEVAVLLKESLNMT